MKPPVTVATSTAPATARLREAKRPLLSSEQAASVLDDVVYQRVVACVDIGALLLVEEELAFALHGCGVGMEAAIEGATSMLTAALERFVGDPDARWPATQGPQDLDGDDEDDDDDCALCAELASQASRPSRRPGRTAGS